MSLCYKVKTVFEMLGKEYEYKKLDKDYTQKSLREVSRYS